MPWNRCATFTGGLLRRPQKHQADGVLGYLGDRSGYEQGTRKRNAAFDHSRTLHDMRCHACRQAAVLIFNLEPLRTGDSNVDHVRRGSHIELLKSSPVEAATAESEYSPAGMSTDTISTCLASSRKNLEDNFLATLTSLIFISFTGWFLVIMID